MMLPRISKSAICPSSFAFSAFCAHTTVPSPYQPWGCRAACQSRRRYASVADGQPSKTDNSRATDQPSWPTSAHPTPYEIFGLSRGGPYNKARYFELAKLYHPDRHHHTSGDGIPHVTKLERYRLVVAANEILSDPQKRRLYDLYGLGWDNEADPDLRARHRTADRTWRQEPGNASMNATWEDWEQWRRQWEGNGEKQEPIFTSNGGFAGIVVLCLLVASWGQVTRAGTKSMTLHSLQDERQAAISRDMQRRQSEMAGMDRERRVESFLRQRELDNWPHDLPGHGLHAEAGSPNGHTRMQG